MNIVCFKDYILLHSGYFYCDASDTVFDAVVTVDCYVEDGKIDIGAGDEYPNMDRFFNTFAERVRLTKVEDGVPIIDINGWLDYNHTKVLEWCRDNWSVDADWNWDDIKYQMIQEINGGIAGNKGNKTYGKYADLFESMPMTPEEA
jgi:hypothetical protein